ncbi:MAG: acyl transferase [Ferruginibacter sp.]|nr:acyl transferase [Ferruginibacter sp.]
MQPNLYPQAAAIFTADTGTFPELALSLFRFQHAHNPVYRQFCDALHCDPAKVDSITKIPFLPIQLFKSKIIHTTAFTPQVIFESSGTTGSINSKHGVRFAGIYEESFRKAFNSFYGDPGNYCIVGLLPSYLERQHSSLVYMVDRLIKDSGNNHSGFYLYDLQKLHTLLDANEKKGISTFLIGVTYALLDFAEHFPMALKNTIVMETGGMKGRREELTREEVHQHLIQQLGINEVHSEYGMTELLSQAYSTGNGRFQTPPWMKIILRAEDDPFELTGTVNQGKRFISGAINVIDLANIYSCAFIATDDAGKLFSDGSFEVIGRLDNSDIRGCGLMIL